MFVNTVRIKSTDLKNKFLFLSFAAFCATLMKGKAADYHMLVRMIREIKVPRDRFRCVLVVFLYVTKVFSESVAKSSPCFADV